MTFDKLHQDTPENCSCITEAREDLENIFVRQFNRLPNSSEDWDTFFKSKWEKAASDAIYPTGVGCDEICNSKGVSVHIWTNEEQKKQGLSKLEKDFSLSRKPKKCLFIFKFKTNSGLIKQTGFLTHHNFYKCDAFSVASLEQIGDIILAKDLLLPKNE